jgi:hypothetical protein
MRLQLRLGLGSGGGGQGSGGAGVELREDGTRELREDGGLELRDVDPSGGINTVPEDEDSDGDAEGLDTGTIIYDGGFTGAPTIGNQGNGKRISGDSSNFAKLLFSLGAPVAGATYTMTYDPDFSAMTLTGKLAMVGFAFKNGKPYHITGLRGDGAAGLNAYKAYGSNFAQLNAASTEDGGAAANGTQAGANWLQIEINTAGTTYTLRTSADGETWDDEFTDDLPDPIASSTAAIDFGPAVYFDATDKGVFTVDITLWISVPAQFGTADWSVADDGTRGDITITVTTLPNDHGSTITDLEYQIDGGSWVSLGGATVGDYSVSGLTNDVEVDVAIRAVSASGNGPASDTKAVTPTGGSVMDFAYLGTSENAFNLSTYTFASVSFGDADASRVIAVTVHGVSLSSRSITGVTIGGVTATAAVTATASRPIGIWYAAVPTGTTGNVVVTFSNTVLNCLIGRYRLVPSVSTPLDTGDSTAGGPPRTASNIEVVDGGCVINAISISGATHTNLTPTSNGVDQFVAADYATDPPGGGNSHYVSASMATTEDATTNDIGWSWSGNDGQALVASWR